MSNEAEPSRNGGTTENDAARLEALVEARRKVLNETPVYVGVDVDETPDALTITLSGPALANIRELQHIIDGATGTSHTATDFVWDFMLDSEWMTYVGSKVAPDFAQTMAELAACYFDEPMESELIRRFRAAGFTVGANPTTAGGR